MEQQSNKPTHRAYAVKGNGDKSHWREIGALWAHKDDKGFSLKLDLIPNDGSDIAIRLIEPKPTSEDVSWTEKGGEK